MIRFGSVGRWYIGALILLSALLLSDIASRFKASREQIIQQFEATFERDASRREGMRDFLFRDAQAAVQLALHSIAPLADADTDEARWVILDEAFREMRGTLRHSRYDFFNTFLVQETPDGDLILRGRYPVEAPIIGISVANTPLFNHVDPASIELFEESNAVYQVEADPLLAIASPQPVLISTRLIFDGDSGQSRWFSIHSVGLAAANRNIDSIGQQMVGGITPMRIITVDAKTGDCLFAWDAGADAVDCSAVALEDSRNYLSRYNSDRANAMTYSVYQPNEAYKALKTTAAGSEEAWRAAIPATLALILLFTTAAYMRFRATSADTIRSFADSLLVKDSVNTSIHDVLSRQLERMSQFAFSMRDGDIPESERRYFDIAISEFMQATLSLNTLRLESPPTSAGQRPRIEKVDLKQLTSLGQMVLEVSTIDTPVDAKFLSADDLPDTVLGYSYSIQTALMAALGLSAETTDEGRIEVSLWTEEVEGFECLYLRIIDSGIGWGLALDQSAADSSEAEGSAARKALLACLDHSGTKLLRQEESEYQNEYELRLCNGNPEA